MGKVTDLVTAPVTALSATVDFGAAQGAGYEDVQASDLKIPFLKVLQATSAQTKKKDEAYVPNAEPGNILLTIPETLIDGDKGAVFVFAGFQHVFVEQVPYDQGRGFRGIRTASDPDVAAARAAYQRTPEGRKKPLANYPTPHGTEYAETYQVFGVLVDEETMTPLGQFSFGAKGKGIGPFKTWLTTINGYRHQSAAGPQQPPVYAHVGRITTTYEKNDSGEFFVPKFVPAFNRQVKDSLVGPGTPLYEMARELHEIVMAGRVDESSYGAGDDPLDNTRVNDDVPF